MGKQSQKAEFNNFIKGLITEAGPLNFPENASQDEENFELDATGVRRRRLGLGYETNSTLRTSPTNFSSFDPKNTVTAIWKSVRGIASDTYLVVQVNKVLMFFDTSASDISNTGYKGQLELTSFPTNTKFSFTSIDGRLIVACGGLTIAIVSYDGTNFSAEYDYIKVRDVWGVEETLYTSYETDPSYRDANLGDIHAYNLQNQSWGIPRKDSSGTLVDPITYYKNSLSVYPSNSEAVWPGLQFQPVASGVTPYERIFPNLYTETLGANPSSAKGYYIIDLLQRGSSRMSQFASNKTKYSTLTLSSVTLPTDLTSGGATVIAEYAGRAWYSGFSGQVTSGDKRSPDLSNFVVFSQLVKSRQDIAKCYEETDPTSRESPGVVDTDGGFIRISGIKEVIGLVNIELGLVVIGSNGVWVITGGSDDGFKASNYKVSKISSSGCISADSIVQEGGRLYYWSEDGIHVVGKDQVGSLGVISISQSTIQSFYEEIPSSVLLTSKGVYDPYSKRVRWIYTSGTSFTSDLITRELVFDTTLKAFYKNKIMNHVNAMVVGLFAADPFVSGTSDVAVYSGADDVLSGSDSVVIAEDVQNSGLQSIRYIVAVNTASQSRFTISYLNNPKFLDWEEVDGTGVDAKGYLLTGDMTGGDSSVEKQIPYITTHFYRTEDGVTPGLVPNKQSGCLVRTRWGWSDSDISNKWSPFFQAYRYRRALYIESGSDPYDNGLSLVTTRSKIRGRGKAFSIYFETEPLKDCQLVGWSLRVTGNTL